jgi:hypothetical protein
MTFKPVIHLRTAQVLSLTVPTSPLSPQVPSFQALPQWGEARAFLPAMPAGAVRWSAASVVWLP